MNQEHRRRPDAKESGLMQRVRKSVRALPFKTPHVLLACSGGKDSVALAWILAELQRLNLISLSIAHIHHGQHHMADSAAQAVQQIGHTLNVPVVVHRIEQAAINAHSGAGLEEALRRERYLALASIATETHADCIAVAHHESDQAETILLHLLRGSGLDGLVGMREWEMRTVPWWTQEGESMEIGIWRPLVRESAKSVAQTAGQSGLPIVEDPTNIDTAFRRNAIRHELLPVIDRIAPGATSSIARTSDLIGGDAHLLQQLTADSLGDALDDRQLVRDRLIQLPEAMQRRVVRAWIMYLHPNLEPSLERVEAILSLAQSNRGGARVELGSGSTVELKKGRLHLNPWHHTDE